MVNLKDEAADKKKEEQHLKETLMMMQTEGMTTTVACGHIMGHTNSMEDEDPFVNLAKPNPFLATGKGGGGCCIIS